MSTNISVVKEKYEGKTIKSWYIKEYINKHNVKVVCAKCNKEFTKRLSSILEGYGCCNDCRLKESAELKSKSHEGEESTNIHGLKMTLTRYRNSMDVDFVYSNGEKAEHSTYSIFKEGNCRSKRETERLKSELTNQQRVNKFGVKYVIFQVTSESNIIIKFTKSKVYRKGISLNQIESGDVTEDTGEEYISKAEESVQSVLGNKYTGKNGLDVVVIGGENRNYIEVEGVTNRIKQVLRLSDLERGSFNSTIMLRKDTEFTSIDGYSMVVSDTPVNHNRDGSRASSCNYCTVTCKDTDETIEFVKKSSIKDGTFSYTDKENFIVTKRKGFRRITNSIITLNNGLKCKCINVDLKNNTCDLEVVDSSEPVVFRGASYTGVVQGNFPTKHLDSLTDYVLNNIIQGVKISGVHKYIGQSGSLYDGTKVVIKNIYKRGNNYRCDVDCVETKEELKDLSLRSVLIGSAMPDKNYSKVGDTEKALTGQVMRIVELLDNYRALVEFEDGVRVDTERKSFKRGRVRNPNFYIQGKGVRVGSKVGVVDIEKLAYDWSNTGDKYYMCKCNKCSMKDILTPREILLHKCNEGIVKVPQWVLEEQVALNS